MARVLVICARRYNGHELWTLLGILKRNSHTFEVISTDHTIKDELTFRPNTIKRTIPEFPLEEVPKFDGVCVVSGNMADTEAYWTSPQVLAILQAFRDEQKLTAAICCSVPTLAPIVNGIRVSFFPLVRSRQRLAEHGAILQTTSLTVDGKTITAENQMVSQMWAEEISAALNGLPPIYNLADSGFVPKGRPRRLPTAIQQMVDEAKNGSATS